MKSFHIPPIWQHDAYLLRPLIRRVHSIAERWATPDSTVVDMGAGMAPYRLLFTAKGAHYICCDLPGTSADITIKPGEKVNLSDGMAAIVTSFQVLEHVWDINWYLSEVRRILRDDGIVVLSTHGVWLYHPHPTDFRRWTCDGLVKEMETRGFTVQEFYGMVGPLAWTILFNEFAIYGLLKKLPVIGAPMCAALASVCYLLMMVGDWITPREWVRLNSANYILVAKKRP